MLKKITEFRSRLNPGRRAIMKNTGWLFGDRAVRMGIGFFVNVWVIRYLGPERLGILDSSIALVLLFSVFATLGLDTIVIRNIVRDASRKNLEIGTAFVLKLSGGCITLLLSLSMIVFLRPEAPEYWWVVGIISCGVIFMSFDAIDFWFQSQSQSKYTVIAKNLAFTVSAIVKVILIQSGASLRAFAIIWSVEFMIAAIGMAVAYRVKGNRMREWTFRFTEAKRLLRESWPLILSGVMIMVYMKIDQIMLAQMRGAAETGVYSTAVRLVELWYFLSIAITNSVFPSVVRGKELGEEIFYNRLQKLYNIVALMGYAIAIPVVIGAGWVVMFLFGPVYQGATPIIQLLIWSILFTNLGVARTSFLLSMNLTKYFFLTACAGAVINVLLNLWLIPLYGGMGCVMASLFSYWFAAHGSCFLFAPLRKTGWMMTKALIWPKVW